MSDSQLIKDGKKLACLDALRGIASVVVVISHLAGMYYPYLHNFSSDEIPADYPIQRFIHHSVFAFFFSGTAAVYIFFVMSGIVLSLMISKRAVPLSRHILSRYVRLAIPAGVSCVLAWAILRIMLAFYPVQQSNFVTDSFLMIEHPGLLDSVYYGFVRAIFYLRGSKIYNPVLWTMPIEFFGSLALFIAYKTKKPLQVMFLLTMVFLIINRATFLGVLSFFIGMWIKEKCLSVATDNSRVGNDKVNGRKNTLFSYLLFIIGLYFAGVHNDSASYLWLVWLFHNSLYDILNFLAGVCIVLAIVKNSTMQRFLQNRLLVKSGKLSFPLYFTHWMVLYAFGVLFAKYQLPSMLSAAILLLLTLLVAIPFISLDNLAIYLGRKVKR